MSFKIKIPLCKIHFPTVNSSPARTLNKPNKQYQRERKAEHNMRAVRYDKKYMCMGMANKLCKMIFQLCKAVRL